MSFLGKFGKLDQSLKKLDGSIQRGLDNGFAFLMGGTIVASEVEALLKATADDNAVATYDGYTESPNHFTVRLSAKDFANLRSSNPTLAESCAELLGRYSRNKGWVPAGPVVVLLSEDPGLKTGQCHVDCLCDPEPHHVSCFVADGESALNQSAAQARAARDSWQQDFASHPADFGADISDFADPTPATDFHHRAEVSAGAAAPADHRPARGGDSYLVHAPTVTLLLQDGSSRTYLVQEGSTIIGRGPEADFRLPDTGVSRTHAEITWDGRDAVLTDLHSTNGTTVNNVPVDNWLLADGDVITVGHSLIEVRITNPGQGW